MMGDFDERWRRLAKSAQRAAPPIGPIATDRARRIARQGLALQTRTAPSGLAEPWAWAGLAGFAAAAAMVLFWIDAPLSQNATVMAAELSTLPRRVPARPALPGPPQVARPFELPPSRVVVAALTHWR